MPEGFGVAVRSPTIDDALAARAITMSAFPWQLHCLYHWT
jgi:hypothetical protein